MASGPSVGVSAADVLRVLLELDAAWLEGLETISMIVEEMVFGSSYVSIGLGLELDAKADSDGLDVKRESDSSGATSVGVWVGTLEFHCFPC